MTVRFADAKSVMQRAIDLARQGEGHVEPNPLVGAVIVDDQLERLGEGYHERFGGPHAEVNAIAGAGDRSPGATLYVTLEPCSRQGKTPPCTTAVLRAGLRRVVVGLRDPSQAEEGIAALTRAGVEVEVGLLERECARLAAPFVKRVSAGRVYVHAKWAMTLDGKIAARTGRSRWISNETSRALVHRLRGRMDAILIGAATARTDDPLLTARPPGPRIATRIVLDRRAELSLDSQLVQTAGEAPLLIATLDDAPEDNVRSLESRGAEVLRFARGPRADDASGVHAAIPLNELLQTLAQRGMTNVLVEGGGRLLGSFFDAELIDEVHAWIAPKIVGGRRARTAVEGIGLAEIAKAFQLDPPAIELLDGDVYVHGPLRH